jgi:glycosyltransferase involved in cell wall biosynthesis
MFAVIIPTYNRRGFLEATLQSVWAQTVPPSEVIVVDGASTDGTAEYLESIRDRVTVVGAGR